MNWDVLDVHETGVIPERDRAGKELFDGTQIMDVDLITYGAVSFPVTSF